MAIILKNKNFAESALALSISGSDTTLTVEAGDGGLFPQSGSFRIVIWGDGFRSPVDDPDREILTLTVSSGDIFTAVRGEEGTVAVSWGAGSRVAHVLTAGKIEEIEQEIVGKPTEIYAMDDFYGTMAMHGSALTVSDDGTSIVTEYPGRYKTSFPTANYEMFPIGAYLENEYVFADASSGNMTVTLPEASYAIGRSYFVKRIDSAVTTLTVKPYDGDVNAAIDGDAEVLLDGKYSSVHMVCDGATYYKIGA